MHKLLLLPMLATTATAEATMAMGGATTETAEAITETAGETAAVKLLELLMADQDPLDLILQARLPVQSHLAVQMQLRRPLL
jgi:hypothetical protein